MYQNTTQEINLNTEYQTRKLSEAQQHQLAEIVNPGESFSVNLPVKPLVTAAIIILLIVFANPGTAQAQDMNLEPTVAGSDRGDAMVSAIHFMQLGDYETAIAWMSESIERESDNAGAYAIRGHAYFLLGEYETAIEDSRTALMIVPEFASPYWTLGEIYFELEDYAQAEVSYQTYLELAGKDAIDDVYERLQSVSDKNATEES